uniref:Ig-like domain-containing protein n=1 Tax=Oryzias sinensis TaxID=183150 RepID=A0A8C8DHJ9_9TELE
NAQTCYECKQDSVVDGSVGGSVLLPCIFTGPPPKQINVAWRDEDTKAVLNIKNGSPVFSDQNQKYQGRVFSFQEEFKNGNFSIQMKNLQISDSDTYVCTMIPGGDERRVQLRVSGEMKMISNPEVVADTPGHVTHRSLLGMGIVKVLTVLLLLSILLIDPVF